MIDHAPNEQCFLCKTPADLVFLETDNFLALAGLGPVVDGYCMLASRTHARSMADIKAARHDERDGLVKALRAHLASEYGCCLITEHGRMAICDDDLHDQHCYHAHFLVFPGAPDISSKAQSYFGSANKFANLSSALSFSANFEEYFLVSPDDSSFTVFTTPLNAPRQLARYLVAAEAGDVALADWKSVPNRQRALEIAEKFRREQIVMKSRC